MIGDVGSYLPCLLGVGCHRVAQREAIDLDTL
jgi:hypothetical protein